MINQRSTTSQITWLGIAGKVDSDHTAKLGPNLVPNIRPPKIPAATFLQGASLAEGPAAFHQGCCCWGKGFPCPKDHYRHSRSLDMHPNSHWPHWSRDLSGTEHRWLELRPFVWSKYRYHWTIVTLESAEHGTTLFVPRDLGAYPVPWHRTGWIPNIQCPWRVPNFECCFRTCQLCHCQKVRRMLLIRINVSECHYWSWTEVSLESFMFLQDPQSNQSSGINFREVQIPGVQPYPLIPSSIYIKQPHGMVPQCPIYPLVMST